MKPTERVAAALEALRLPAKVVEFDASTATAEAAAAAVGCELGQIVKTLVFLADGRPTMVLAAGDRLVDTAKLAELLGVSRKRLKMGSADEVLAMTGYPVGGVSPVGGLTRCDVVADASLGRFERVWAAAGGPHAVFGIGREELVSATRAQWGAITREAS